MKLKAKKKTIHDETPEIEIIPAAELTEMVGV
jgi:hypothetical protein